jgi:transposase
MNWSTKGRTRRLTQAQIDDLLEWANHRISARAKARSLGISVSLLQIIVRSRGRHYKTAPPERRQEARSAWLRRRIDLESRGVL